MESPQPAPPPFKRGLVQASNAAAGVEYWNGKVEGASLVGDQFINEIVRAEGYRCVVDDDSSEEDESDEEDKNPNMEAEDAEEEED